MRGEMCSGLLLSSCVLESPEDPQIRAGAGMLRTVPECFLDMSVVFRRPTPESTPEVVSTKHQRRKS